ncbi:hypothetical protein AQF52_8035 [Streptomyces venezuelae]|uniref:hypothetical protein n=1 Tax=Streptomyces gardneri TaxID=66892 RepID=UPI0006E1594B|nr:hypothetical protein [Streptomyces gardneri]ALO13616.1 hypothetical protein AQF52_8035 [Streptomyces venezuelae]QPK50204.1 hypothetical protein H4W23_40285 [Streptomyces gardneri]WRK41810.1 hypothetical protein U0M97_40535 [Streptomyces venezuelae]
MPWATALTAIAAAIGLFFSGLVASSSVDATRRQFDQDRRQQAGRVAHWTEPVGELSETVVIVNRSLDPVSNVEMLFYAPDAGINPVVHEWLSLGLDSWTMPPCTQLVIAPGPIDAFLRGYGIEQGGAPIRAIRFVDSDGRLWERDEGGLRAAEYSKSDSVSGGDTLSRGAARRKPAEHCDK